MAYTKEQWEALQAKLPPNERMSYGEYLARIAPASAATPPARTDSAASRTANDYLRLGPLGGLGAGVVAGVNPPASPAGANAATDANAEADLEEALAAAEAAKIAASRKAASDAEARADAAVAANKKADEDAAAAAAAASGGASLANFGDAKKIADLQRQIDALNAASANTKTVAQIAADKAAADKAFELNNSIAVLNARFKQFGLESLTTKIRELAVDGATEATITLQLQETPEYKMRFKANTERTKKGLSVLSPADYLNTEDTYRQVLRAYGLKQFDTDAYVSQFIANDMSPAELSNRVVTAVQRVQNADPAVSKTLRDYYGIAQADLVGYVLDPEQQFTKIERQVQASEIGTAARRQGLEAGVGVAEQLAAQGVTQAEAQKGYSTIADILPTAEKLSAIYGPGTGTYNQATAEQEIFNGLASAQRTRAKLTATEIASFSGSSGMAKVKQSTTGQI
jgi:hypothetical protein